MNTQRLESLVKKLTPSIKTNKPNSIYGELVNGPIFDSLSKVIDAKSFVILSFLIYFKKNNKYTDGMSVVINEDLFTFSLISVDQTYVDWTCNECWGEGYIECSYCGGSGEESCDNCAGTGDEPCQDCDGYGEDEDGGICQSCSGNGDIDCDDCAGGGRNNCTQCYGNGSEDCSYCDGLGNGENEDEYKVSQYYYASIDGKLFNLLKDVDVDQLIGDDEIFQMINDLRLTILINTDSYITEYFVNNGIDLSTDDTVFNGINEKPNLYYLSQRVSDRHLEQKY